MSTALALTQVLVAAVIVIGGTAYVLEAERYLRRKDRVVYYASNVSVAGPKVVELIEKYVGDKAADYALAEPGAGLGHMARYLSCKFPWKDVVASDIGPVILAYGRALNWLKGTQKDVSFVWADVFASDLPKPAVVYAYLSSAILDRMHAEGRFAGRLVIALTFPITGVDPTETVELPSWQSPLRVYDFRDL